MKVNKLYRREMKACRFFAKAYDCIPRWMVAAVSVTAITWEIFWYC